MIRNSQVSPGICWGWLYLAAGVLMAACQLSPIAAPTPTYKPSLPPSVKMSPAMDENPPVSFSEEYTAPAPAPGALNSAGGEDSPFILPDGRTIYLFYTPDVSVPAEKQLLDGVTGIYVSHLEGSAWSKPQRVLLQDAGKLALDGCEFVLENQMWFCSAREGYTGIHWFTAEFTEERWLNWREADIPAAYQVGELHLSANGRELYFASERSGGYGKLDLWLSQKVDGAWQEPVNLVTLNSENDEGWPALSPDESELWFTRNYGVWRSRRSVNGWQAPQQMFAPLAGEATLDRDGNVYFVHHFFKDGVMIEADIYVAYRK